MLWLNHHNILFLSTTHLFTGRLALKLVENKLSYALKSNVYALVYHLILWASDPLQSNIEGNQIGRKVGQQSGDFLHSALNWVMTIKAGYFAGVSLDKIQRSMEEYIMDRQREGGGLLQSILLFIKLLF